MAPGLAPVLASMVPIRRALCVAITVYGLVLLVRVIMSWLRPPVSGPMHAAWELVHDVTEPVLTPVRGIIPAAGGIDFSPLLVFVILAVLQSVICF